MKSLPPMASRLAGGGVCVSCVLTSTLSWLAVLFIGGVVGATVETIELDNTDQPPHYFGAVTRWMVMYPPPLSSPRAPYTVPVVKVKSLFCGVQSLPVHIE